MKKKELKIKIGKRTMTPKEFFNMKERFRKLEAKSSLEEKIRNLIQLQKIALEFGKKDIIVWKP